MKSYQAAAFDESVRRAERSRAGRRSPDGRRHDDSVRRLRVAETVNVLGH